MSSYCTRKSVMYTSRTSETFGWRTKESLGALSLRNNATAGHTFKWTMADVCKAQTCLFKWSPLQCDVNRNKLPGDSLKSNCSGKTTKQVASATDVEPFPDSGFPEDESVLEGIPRELNKGNY